MRRPAGAAGGAVPGGGRGAVGRASKGSASTTLRPPPAGAGQTPGTRVPAFGAQSQVTNASPCGGVRDSALSQSVVPLGPEPRGHVRGTTGAPQSQGLCGRIQTLGRTRKPVQIPRQENVISASAVTPAGDRCRLGTRGHLWGDGRSCVPTWTDVPHTHWPPPITMSTCALCLPIRPQRTVLQSRHRSQQDM